MDAYGHLRVLVSLILGLAIARILSGFSRRLQDPERSDPIHSQIVWSLAVLLGAVHFWWWEFALRLINTWNFWIYIFILSYASLFFLMSTLLYPDHIQQHAEIEAFFIRRRRAFFSLFVISFAFDLLDTFIKGREHVSALGGWYLVRTAAGVIISVVAIKARTSRTIMWLGVAWIACDALWITVLYSKLF